MFLKRPLRDCLLALGVWLLLVLTISPYPKLRLDPSVHYHAFAIYVVNLALGLEYRGLYPCCSPTALQQHWQLQTHEPQTLMHSDLRQLFPPETWPQQQTFVKTFLGADIGMILFVRGVWHLTGSYTVATVIQALQLLHLISALLLFYLLYRLLKRPLEERWAMTVPVAMLITLLYTYSSAVTRAVVDYTYYPFAPIALIVVALLLSFLINIRRLTAAILLSFVIGIVIVAASYLRATIFYALLPMVIVVIVNTWKSARRLGLVALFCLLLAGFGGRAVLDRLIWQESWRAVNQTTAHSFWHPIWCGLGEFKNPYGFQWEDRAAEEYVKARQPHAPYASPAYEKVLRDAVLQSLWQEPFWVLSTVARRAWNLTGKWLEFLPGVDVPLHAKAVLGLGRLLFLMGLIGFIALLRRQRPWQLASIVGCLGFDAAMPLLIYSNNYYYNLTTYLAMSIVVVLGCAELMRKVATKATFVS